MKEITTLWVYTLARATKAVVEYSCEMISIISGEYFTLDGLSTPKEIASLRGKDTQR